MKALVQLIIDFSEQAADSSWLVLPFDGRLVRQPQVGGVEQCRNRDRRQGNRPTIIDKPHQPALLPQGLRRQIAVVRRTHNQPQALLLTGHKVAVGLTAVGEYRLGSAVLLVAHPHGLGNGSAGADRRAMALPDPLAHWPS